MAATGPVSGAMIATVPVQSSALADGIETVSALVITSEPAAATTLSRLNFFIF